MNNRLQKVKKKKTFKEAVEATSEVKLCHQKGISALSKDEKKKVELYDSKKCEGSLNIDECLHKNNKYAGDNRWDYAIGYDGKVYFVEVHSAITSQVSKVLKKLEWLKNWLIQSAPEINKLKAERSFYWLQSNGYHILRNSVQERLVNQKGLRPRPKLILK